LRGVALAIVASVAAAGCSSKSTTPHATLLTISGEYSGTAADTVAGAETASTTLAQHGSAVGGTLTLTSTGGTSTESIAWTLTPSGALSGSGTETVGNATCTFSMTGSYSTATNTIAGSYAAVSGCAGTTGTYTLTQTCTDPAASDKRKPDSAINPC
jgi:hypothetical protein